MAWCVSHTKGLSNSAVAYDFFFFRVMSVSKQFIIIDLFGKITLSFSSTDSLFRLPQTGICLLTVAVQYDCKYLNRRRNLVLKLYPTLFQITVSSQTSSILLMVFSNEPQVVFLKHFLFPF